MRPLRALLLGVIVVLAPGWSGGQPSKQFNRNDPNVRDIQSIRIKWKRPTRTAQAPTAEELQRLKQAAGIDLNTYTDHGWGIVFRFPRFMARIEAEGIAAKIRALPEIEDAIPDTPYYLDSGFGGINARIALP